MAAVARASGASRSRIQDGVNELESGTAPVVRIRRVGGGRKPAEEADPGLLPALLALVEPTRRGDPESALSWTTLSVRRLAAPLAVASSASSVFHARVHRNPPPPPLARRMELHNQPETRQARTRLGCFVAAPWARFRAGWCPAVTRSGRRRGCASASSPWRTACAGG